MVEENNDDVYEVIDDNDSQPIPLGVKIVYGIIIIIITVAIFAGS